MMAKAKSKNRPLEEPGLTDVETGATGSPTPSEHLDQPTLGSSPTPAQAEAAVERAKAEAAAKVDKESKPVLSAVPLRVFRQVAGVKVAEFRSFEVYVQREEMRPCTIPEWRDRFQAFRSMPTKKLKRFTPAR